MLQISEKIRQKKRRFWNNYQHFMKRGYTQLFIKKGHPRGCFFGYWLLALGFWLSCPCEVEVPPPYVGGMVVRRGEDLFSYVFCFFLLLSRTLQNSTKLRWMTPPTCSCSLYCATMVGDMLRFNAKRTTSMLASLHNRIPMLGFSLDRRSS